MPLYDFACWDCGKAYEVKVPLKDFDKEVLCPKCGKPLERQISPVRFVVR